MGNFGSLLSAVPGRLGWGRAVAVSAEQALPAPRYHLETGVHSENKCRRVQFSNGAQRK